MQVFSTRSKEDLFFLNLLQIALVQEVTQAVEQMGREGKSGRVQWVFMQVGAGEKGAICCEPNGSCRNCPPYEYQERGISDKTIYSSVI